MAIYVENLDDYPLAEDNKFAISVSRGVQILVNGEKRGENAMVQNGDTVSIVSTSYENFRIKCQVKCDATLSEPIRKPKQKPYVDYRKPYFQRQNSR